MDDISVSSSLVYSSRRQKWCYQVNNIRKWIKCEPAALEFELNLVVIESQPNLNTVFDYFTQSRTYPNSSDEGFLPSLVSLCSSAVLCRLLLPLSILSFRCAPCQPADWARSTWQRTWSTVFTRYRLLLHFTSSRNRNWKFSRHRFLVTTW